MTSIILTEPTREQDNAAQALSLRNGGQSVRVSLTSPRIGCICATLPTGRSEHINEDGVTVHVSMDTSLARYGELLA